MTDSNPKRRTWRTSFGVRTLLVASLAAASFMGTYEYFTHDESTVSAQSDSAGSTAKSTDESPQFFAASQGDCLTWDVNDKGSVSNFQQADCSSEHRFEVASTEDLEVYPTSEFGPDAPMPNQKRQAQLRQELCYGATIKYLDGKYDPAGRFDVAPILPPKNAWEQGDRTMLCGLQSVDNKGVAELTKGRVAEVDQANLAEPGMCREISDNQMLRNVDCADPHQLETVSIVNLAEEFPDAYPSIEDQDKYLVDRCTNDAMDYLGGKEKLDETTLQPYWGTVSEASWNSGTRSVNCSLMKAKDDGGSFSDITGRATDGVGALSINGQPPAPKPE